MADRVASGAARTLSHSLNLWAPPGLSGQSGRLHISTNFIGEALSISGAAQEERVGTSAWTHLASLESAKVGRSYLCKIPAG